LFAGGTVAAVPAPVPVAEAAGGDTADAELAPEDAVESVVPLAVGGGEPDADPHDGGAAAAHGHCPAGAGGAVVPAFDDGTSVDTGALEETELAVGGVTAEALGTAAESLGAGTAAVGTAAEALGTAADAPVSTEDALATGGTEMDGTEEPEGKDDGGVGGIAGGILLLPPAPWPWPLQGFLP